MGHFGHAVARLVDAEPAHGLGELAVVERAREVLVHRSEDGLEHPPRAQVLAQVLHDTFNRRSLGRRIPRLPRALRRCLLRRLALRARRLVLSGRTPVMMPVIVLAHLLARHLDEVGSLAQQGLPLLGSSEALAGLGGEPVVLHLGERRRHGAGRVGKERRLLERRVRRWQVPVGVAYGRGGGCQRGLNDAFLETVHCSTAVLLLLCGWRLGDVRRQGVEFVYAGDVVPVARADDAPASRMLVKARVLRRSLGHRWRCGDGDVRVDLAKAGGTRAGLEGAEGSLIMAFVAQVDWN